MWRRLFTYSQTRHTRPHRPRLAAPHSTSPLFTLSPRAQLLHRSCSNKQQLAGIPQRLSDSNTSTGPLKAGLAAIRPLIRAPCCLANSPAGAFRKAPSTSAALAPPMGCRATRESAQWGPDGPRTGCRCSGSTPITHTVRRLWSRVPSHRKGQFSHWRCGKSNFRSGGVEIAKIRWWCGSCKLAVQKF